MQLLHDTLMRFDTFDNSGKFVEPADWRNDWATAMECLKQTLRLLDPHFDLTWQETSAPKYPNHWREGMLNTQFKSVCYASEKEPPELQDVIVGADRIRLSEDGRLCRIFDKTLRRLWLLVDLLRVVHGVCSSKMSWFRGTPAAPQAATQAPWFQASQAAQQLELGPELRGSHPGGPQKHDHAGLQQQQMVSAVRQDDVAQVHSAQPVTLSHSTPQMQQVQLGRPAPVDTSAPATAPPPVYNPEQLNQACATKFCSMTQGADTLDQLAFQKAFIEPADPAKGKAPTEAQIQLTQRLFRALDKDNDGRISFEEYHEAMRVYHNGTFEERAELVWNVYAGSEDEVLSDSLKQVSKGCLDMVKNDVMSRECLSPVHRDLLASTEEQELEDSLNQSIVSLKGEIDAMPGTSPTRSAPGGFLIQKDAFIQMCKKSATMQVGVNPAYSPSGGLSPGQPGFIQTHGGYQDAAAPHAFGQQSLNRTT